MLTNRRVLWLGDSITQDGRYVSFVEYYLNKHFPRGDRFDIVSIGLSSETLSGLSEASHPFPRPWLFDRLGRAIEQVKPATVVACYGINDGIYYPKSKVRTDAFHGGVKRLLNAAKLAGAEVILITPPPFDRLPVADKLRKADASDFGSGTPFEDYDAVLTDFSGWETKLPVGEVRLVVDLHTVMNAYIFKQRATGEPEFSFTTDGIHPSSAGHLLMARTFVEAIGVELHPIDDLDQELARVKADPMLNLVHERREKRSAGWLRYIGYAQPEPVQTDSVGETEGIATSLQDQIGRLRTP